MKHLFLTLLTICALCLVGNAQNTIQLEIDHRLGGADFEYNTPADQGTYMFDISRLQYYISDIQITHDGGTVTDIEDVWILVSATSGSSSYALGSWDIEEVEAIHFSVGVGPDVNNEDPASWPLGHPLAPVNPSMHWGWASGYRFVAIEGNAGTDSPSNVFEIHALGNDNYFDNHIMLSASADGGVVTVPVQADYVNALTTIDMSAGLVNHSISGPSVTLLQNFSTEVFSAGGANSLEENFFEGEVRISPNPSKGSSTLTLDLPEGENYSLLILDVNGRIVERLPVHANAGELLLPSLTSGMYFVELLQNDQPLTINRWAVE